MNEVARYYDKVLNTVEAPDMSIKAIEKEKLMIVANRRINISYEVQRRTQWII